MKKTIKKYATEYLLEGLLCMEEGEGYSDIDIEEAFIAGHAHALDVGAEGFDEWAKYEHLNGSTIYDELKVAWIASRLSAQKELEMNEARINKLEAELKQQRFNNKNNLSIDQKLADRVRELESKNEALILMQLEGDREIKELRDDLDYSTDFINVINHLDIQRCDVLIKTEMIRIKHNLDKA